MFSHKYLKCLKTLRMMLPVLIWVMLGSCALPEQTFMETSTDAMMEGYEPERPRISCFLSLADPKGPALRMGIASFEILAGDIWLPIIDQPMTLDSKSIGPGQIHMGSISVPPGQYKKVRLTITGAELQNSEGKFIVLKEEPLVFEAELTEALSLDGNDRDCMIVTWDVENSLQANNQLVPSLIFSSSLDQLFVDLLFVSCPDVDTIFIVRVDKNWVVDSFGLKGHPTYLYADPTASQERLYVLTPGDRAIKVVSLASQRVIDFFSASLFDAPTFMTIDPEGEWAYLLDERSGYLSRMNLTTGNVSARVLLDTKPQYMTYMNEQNLLAVSQSLSQEVLLLDPVDLTRKRTIPTGVLPLGIGSWAGQQLYVAEYEEGAVSIIDLEVRGNQRRVDVGLGPCCLQTTDDHVYVSNELGGSISILSPVHFGVIQELYGFGQPKEMVFSRFYRRLYVADKAKAALGVIDVNANLVQGMISLGAKPMGLAIVQ